MPRVGVSYQKLGRGKEGILPNPQSLQREPGPADTLSLDFSPPEVEETTLLSFQGTQVVVLCYGDDFREYMIKDTGASSLPILSWISHSRGHQLPCHKDSQAADRQAPMVITEAAHRRPREEVTLKVGLPAPVKPLHDGSPCRHPNYTHLRSPELKPPLSCSQISDPQKACDNKYSLF